MMDLVEKYRHADDFSELQNELLNREIDPKAFYKYALYYTAETHFQKYCSYINYNLKDRNKMSDIKLFKESLEDLSDDLDHFEFPNLVFNNTNFEIFKLIVDNYIHFDSFNVEDNTTFYVETEFTVDKINYIMQNKDIVDNTDIFDWFENIIYFDKSEEIIKCLLNYRPNIILHVINKILNDNLDDDLNKLLKFVSKEYHDNIFKSAIYSEQDNRKHIKTLLEKGFIIPELDEARIVNKFNKYGIIKTIPLKRKLPDDYECPVMYTKIKLYYLCSQSDLHAISDLGYTEKCPLCRKEMDIILYENN